MDEKQMKNTGYPSIDKPWMKYYGANIKYDMEYCDVKLVDFMRNSAEKHLKETAIIYFGNKISYEKLLTNITRVTSAFVALGVKNNDSVALMLPNLPETIYAEYALNDLGACFVPIDPRTGVLSRKLNFNNSVMQQEEHATRHAPSALLPTAA